MNVVWNEMEEGGAKIRFSQSALKDVIQALKTVNG